MHYYILGTDHTLQEPDRRTPAAKALAYREMLRTVIREHSPVLIAEEINANRPDEKQNPIGRQLAASIPWISVDMTFPEQREAHIFEDLDEDSRLRDEEDRNTYHVCANTVREKHWLTKIQQEIDRLKLLNGTVLITCGRNHLEFLADKAISSGAADYVYLAEHPRDIKQTWPPLELFP